MSNVTMRARLMIAVVAILLFTASASTAQLQAGGGVALNMQTSVGGLAVPGGLNTLYITVVVTNTTTGKPVSTLGQTTGSGSGPITLPQGWTFTQMTSAGDLFLPVKFTNRGKGVYDIDVRVFFSTWQKGFHSYVVRYASTVYNGATTGSFTIVDQ